MPTRAMADVQSPTDIGSQLPPASHLFTQLIDSEVCGAVVIHPVWVIANSHQVLCVGNHLDVCVLLLLVWQAGMVVHEHTSMWPGLVAAAAKDDPIDGEATILLVLLHKGVDVTYPVAGAIAATADGPACVAAGLLLQLLLQ